ncbi:Uncharacterised protein [Mycobacterium tuberculosis]|nr:Uncharacterised protein [Mycobacterium tuberculosis]
MTTRCACGSSATRPAELVVVDLRVAAVAEPRFVWFSSSRTVIRAPRPRPRAGSQVQPDRLIQPDTPGLDHQVHRGADPADVCGQRTTSTGHANSLPPYHAGPRDHTDNPASRRQPTRSRATLRRCRPADSPRRMGFGFGVGGTLHVPSGRRVDEVGRHGAANPGRVCGRILWSWRARSAAVRASTSRSGRSAQRDPLHSPCQMHRPGKARRRPSRAWSMSRSMSSGPVCWECLDGAGRAAHSSCLVGGMRVIARYSAVLTRGERGRGGGAASPGVGIIVIPPAACGATRWTGTCGV